MMGKTHIAIGLAATTFTTPLLRWPGVNDSLLTFAVSVGVVALGSLTPDLDRPGSTLSSLVAGPFGRSRIAALLGGVGTIYISGKFNLRFGGYDLSQILSVIGIILLVMALMKHRGVTHSLIGVVVALYATNAFQNLGFYQHYVGVPIVKPFMVGYIAHLLADFISGEIGGIAPLYPFVEKRIVPPFSIPNGGLLDRLVIRYLEFFLAIVRIFHVSTMLVSLIGGRG